MIEQDIKVYKPFGEGGRGQRKYPPGTTPENIDPIGKPSIHLISGSTGVGKSNIARNMVEAWDKAHDEAGTTPDPDVLIYTGSGGDPVWKGMNPKRVKLFTPQTEGGLIDEINKRYDRAMRHKKDYGLVSDGEKKKMPAVPSDISKAMGSDKKAEEMEKEEAHRPSLIVVDDAGSSALFPSRMLVSPIAQAVQSHRHADMTFIVSSQRYHSHNPWLRANASTINAFPPKGADEFNFLKRDLPLPHEAMRRGFAVASAKGPHNFVHVDVRNRRATHNFSGEEI